MENWDVEVANDQRVILLPHFTVFPNTVGGVIFEHVDLWNSGRELVSDITYNL